MFDSILGNGFKLASLLEATAGTGFGGTKLAEESSPLRPDYIKWFIRTSFIRVDKVTHLFKLDYGVYKKNINKKIK